MPDVDGDRVVRTDGILIPDALIDLVDGENPPLIFDEEQKDVIFDRCQLHRLIIDRNLLRVIIDDKSADLVNCLVLRRQAAE